jgi:hypothetical protein
VLLVVYLWFKRAESRIELERLVPSTLFSSYLKTQIDPRVVCELGAGVPVLVGQIGIPRWTTKIKEKTARVGENDLDIVCGGDFGGQRN